MYSVYCIVCSVYCVVWQEAPRPRCRLVPARVGGLPYCGGAPQAACLPLRGAERAPRGWTRVRASLARAVAAQRGARALCDRADARTHRRVDDMAAGGGSAVGRFGAVGGSVGARARGAVGVLARDEIGSPRVSGLGRMWGGLVLVWQTTFLILLGGLFDYLNLEISQTGKS